MLGIVTPTDRHSLRDGPHRDQSRLDPPYGTLPRSPRREMHRGAGLAPLAAGDDLPPFCCCRTAEFLYLVFAHPKARERVIRRITVNLEEVSHALDLVFEPYQSLVVRVSRSEGVRFVDIEYWRPEPACSP